MIQRIQSLYLLVVAGLMAVMLSVPLAKFLEGDTEYLLKAFGIYLSSAEGGPVEVSLAYMGILIVLAALVPLATIFFYRNRLLQIRLCFIDMVLLAGLQVFVAVYVIRGTVLLSGLEDSSVSYTAADILPAVSLVLVWLAYKGIVRDEALVRSLDRIR